MLPSRKRALGPNGSGLSPAASAGCDHVHGAENTVVNEPDKFSRADTPGAESTNNKVAVGGLQGLGHPRREAGALCPQGPRISLGVSRTASSWRRCRLWPSQDWSCPRAKPAPGGQGSCRKAGKFPVVTEGNPDEDGRPRHSQLLVPCLRVHPLQVASLCPLQLGASCGQ